MWVRNAANAQLTWSTDRGRTWEWGWKLAEGFATPAFLNFGRDYSGARDNFVYTYSQEGASAYESDDHLLLARAPVDRLRDRNAWEFLERFDGGRPVWTSDIARRGPVFRYPRSIQRVEAVYNPGLKRYLLALGYDHSSRWGIFDAAEPWGPWTTVLHADPWDLKGTHGYRLPSKWIDATGRELTLVFSGVKPYDAFCVRAMQLESR